MTKTYFCFFFVLFSCFAFSQKKISYINSVETIAKGIALHDSLQYEAALVEFEKIHNGDTNYSSALYEKAYSLNKLKRYEEAITAAQEGIALNRDNLGLFYNCLGNAYDGMGDTEKAIETYTNGIKRFPYNHLLYYNRGVAYANIKNWDQAIADYQQALKIYPFHANSHYQLALLALGEKEYARALLSASNFYMIEPVSYRAQDLLVLLDRILIGDTIPTPKGITFPENENFSTLNLLIENGVALDDRYEVPSELPLDVVKQFYLVFDKAGYAPENPGFWNQYYLPLADKILEEEQFELLSYILLSSSASDTHQEIIGKHKFTDYYVWLRQQIIDLHNPHTIMFEGKSLKVDFHYDQKLTNIGNLDESGQNFEGDYWVVNTSGGINLHGKTINGKNEGIWVLYYENGSKKDSVFFKNDYFNGNFYSWFPNGQLKTEQSYKQGELDGYSVFYKENGAKDRSMHHKENLFSDTLFYYYPDGKVWQSYPKKNGEDEGLFQQYFPDGSLEMSLMFKEGKATGTKKDYYFNRQLYLEENFKNGEQDGPSSSWYSDGQLWSQGNYKNGKAVGEWKAYYPDGTLQTKLTYDENGEEKERIEYSPAGLMKLKYIFKNGKIAKYTFFGKEGEIIAEGDRSWGKLDYKGYNIHGAVVAEGRIEDSYQVELWKFYDENGLLESTVNFDEKENKEGVSKYYYPSGQVSSIENHKNGKIDGYYVAYHPSGQMRQQGYYVDGESEGMWYFYDYDGKLESTSFYVNNKLNGARTYYHPDGNRQLEEFYRNGILLSLTSFKDNKPFKTVKLKNGTGTAIWYFSNGKKAYETSYLNNVRYGNSTFYHGNGQVSSSGKYINGKKDGVWTWYSPNGKISYQVTYHMEKKNGQAVRNFFNGEISSIYSYKHDELHGEYKSYDRQGKLIVIRRYQYGKPHGAMEFFDTETGKPNHSRIYFKGRLTGYVSPQSPNDTIPVVMETAKIVSHYPNGQVARTYKVEKGLWEGDYLVYYTNGQIASKTTYKADEPHGVSEEWYPDGTLKEKSNNVYGEIDGEYLLYYPNGQLRRKGNYNNGEKDGIETHYDKNGTITAKYRYRGGNMVEEL